MTTILRVHLVLKLTLLHQLQERDFYPKRYKSFNPMEGPSGSLLILAA